MDVFCSEGLENAVDDISMLVSRIGSYRSQLGFAPFDADMHLTWLDATDADNGIMLPLLTAGHPTIERTTLTEYFETARASIGVTENEAYRFLADGKHGRIEDVSTDGTLIALSHAAARALTTFDIRASIKTIDFARISEAFLHDTSEYANRFRTERQAYTHAFSANSFIDDREELFYGYALEVGVERLRRDVTRAVRIGLIGANLSRSAEAYYDGAAIEDTLNDIDIILNVTSEYDEARSAAFLEAKDVLLATSESYTSKALSAIDNAIRNGPMRLAYADEHAQSADSWLDAVR